MFTGRPLSAAATTRSVWRQRNAGNLQHVHDFGHGGDVGHLMHVSQYRNVHFVFHFLQNAQAFLHARPAIAADRSAVRLVVGRFEDEREIQRTRHALDDLRHAQRVIFALNHAGPGNEEQIASADANVIDLER